MARGVFEEAYLSLPPWDIGRPQGEIIRLAEEGEIRGVVLDAGCGTGENALFLAGRGCEVTGIDAVGIAIRKAKEKSRERRVPVVFLEWDALEISGLGKRFDTVIDCGLFHVFSDEERPLYVAGLSSVLVPGGTLRMLCFSEMEPGDWGPRRVTQREIREAFDGGWKVGPIREARFETNLGSDGCRAWLSSITRE
jgi:cyclopropane fatty-acyl-phospholipid synthase-like methyltransferase